MISRSDMDFLEEAKKAFEESPELGTYRNEGIYKGEETTRIALRYGEDRADIIIYRISDKVAHFSDIIQSAPKLVLEQEVQSSESSIDEYKKVLENLYHSIDGARGSAIPAGAFHGSMSRAKELLEKDGLLKN